MDKKSKRILMAFGVALLALIIIEIVSPKPINWRESFTTDNKDPYGCYVVSEELKTLYNNASTTIINEDPFVFLRDSSYQENSMYLLVNSDIKLDKRQYEKLSNYVSKGNTAFISARNFGKVLKDSLGVDTYSYYYLMEEEMNPVLFSKSFIKDSTKYSYKKGVYKSTFTEIDTLKTKALGYYLNFEDEDIQDLNFIKISFGKGQFYFHTLPEAFTNYYMMEGNQQYVANLLSFENPSEIYIDNYLKAGRKVVKSPMRFVLNQASLKWAYYLVIIGLLVFVMFKGKRVQRVIKVIEPLKNSSVEFTKTIGDLHFQHKDFGNIISKKITYFLEKIRSQYYLDTNNLNEEFCKKLAIKSNTKLEETTKLINTIKMLKGKSFHSEEDLIQLNKLLEEFTL
ncbi:MAG: hypothetical protein COB12_05775 [Flavobacterium sp.]|nr:MAG: hypothetical protein COB12_05775 [Flavobacterium sp.]